MPQPGDLDEIVSRRVLRLGIEVGTEARARDTSNAFDLKDALCRDLLPLVDGAVCDPERPRDFQAQPAFVEKVSCIGHAPLDSTTINAMQAP